MSVAFRILCLFFCLGAMNQCTWLEARKKGDAVARVYDHYLYRSELKGVVPSGLPAPDSIDAARQYIENWIRQQVVLRHAERNLKKDGQDFSEQLETYRNSLVIYAYESELLRQKLDTLVTSSEITEYYNENSVNFQLRENIVKYKYLRIPLNLIEKPFIKKATKLFKSTKDADAEEELESLSQKWMLGYRPDDDNWVNFKTLTTEVPLEVYNEEDFLSNFRHTEIRDSAYLYDLYITDYKMKESTSPLSLEIDNIRNIIINRRKLALIKRMQEEVFEEALIKKEYEIY
ncbi:MAG: hypothetical protein RBR28_01620 [Lentimicrobium sp.]|jgi:hypothetical protein|nr:hypothetical protein [Lentimicrobium sp.]